VDLAFPPVGDITSHFWFWLLIGAVALIVLRVWIARAIADGINDALPNLTRHLARLEDMGRAADDVHKRLGGLDRWLKAESRSNYRLSVVQTLFGTLIGLIAGFAADWVKEGGIGRVAVAIVIGMALVGLGPPLIVRLFAAPEKPAAQAMIAPADGSRVSGKRPSR
jgi:hypothetical protein